VLESKALLCNFKNLIHSPFPRASDSIDILAALFEILQWTPFTLTCIRMKLNMLIQKDKARENYYTVKIVHNITTSSSLIQNASFVNRALLDISARHCLES